MGFIYKITNIITNKCYIGETMQKYANRRFKAHMSAIRRGGGCPALRDAVKKHGEENFKFEVLLTCPDEDRFRLEKEYIKQHNSLVPNGYNIREAGEDSSGFKHSEETKAKISKISKETWKDPEKLKRLRENTKKYWGKEENRKAQSERIRASENHKNGVRNRTLNIINKSPLHYVAHKEDVKKKISESLKKYHNENKHSVSDATKKKIGDAQCKPIIQYDKEGKMIKKFISTKEASLELNITQGAISQSLRGRSKTCGGFIWKFDETV
jgi:group I intron endonuclease